MEHDCLLSIAFYLLPFIFLDILSIFSIQPRLFPIRSAKLLGVKNIKNTAAVCLSVVGANPPKSVVG